MSCLLLGSCNFFSEKKRLAVQNDSLQNAAKKMESEMTEYISTINRIQENINQIRLAEQSISVRTNSELNNDSFETDMEFINDLIKRNRQEIDSLKLKLENNPNQIAELEKTIERLNNELEIEREKIHNLHIDIINRDLKIRILDTQIKKLSQNNGEVKQTSTNPTATFASTTNSDNIKQQPATHIDVVWYVIGTKKELQDKNIITKNGRFNKNILKPDFDTGSFTQTDKKTRISIPLHAETVKILTSHPATSYFLELQDNGIFLHLTNPERFWANSKYLVVQTD